MGIEVTPHVKQKRDLVQLWEIGHNTTIKLTTRTGSQYTVKRGSSGNNFSLTKDEVIREVPLGDPIAKGAQMMFGRGEDFDGCTTEVVDIEIENPEPDKITPRIREIAAQYAPLSPANTIQNDVSEKTTATGTVTAEPKDDNGELRFRISDMFHTIQEIDFSNLTVAEFTNMIGTINTYLHDNLPVYRASNRMNAYQTRTETIKLLDGRVQIRFLQIYTTVQGEIKLTPFK